MVEDGVTGMLAKNGEDMARRAVELLSGDAGRLISFTQAAQESWSHRFTLQRYQREILGAIEAAGAP